ncbi:ferredoxin [Nocardioides mangrovi]|uniref:Ferredoxin n=1 Tax=Nocardioides mangrovi TaxID=2874580 RepID=A0ABS7UA81_9ACTN|nr:ferredoxin [Nocardioides mangrovi]MBZ5737891.1 ferredoxin [Nocardioides mangrovi]
MRIDVDWTRCDGHGLCALLLAENLTTDAAGFPVVTRADVPPGAERDARRAAAACPALALRVIADT